MPPFHLPYLFLPFFLSPQKEKPLSRLYGYSRLKDGSIESVPNEALIITQVFELYALGNTTQTIKTALDSQSSKNRSGKPFSMAEIEGLVRPVYAGYRPGRFGLLYRSSLYRPIVTKMLWRTGNRNLSFQKTQIDPSKTSLRGRRTIGLQETWNHTA
jgi:hypothetical protein